MAWSTTAPTPHRQFWSNTFYIPTIAFYLILTQDWQIHWRTSRPQKQGAENGQAPEQDCLPNIPYIYRRLLSTQPIALAPASRRWHASSLPSPVFWFRIVVIFHPQEDFNLFKSLDGWLELWHSIVKTKKPNSPDSPLKTEVQFHLDERCDRIICKLPWNEPKSRFFVVLKRMIS